MTHISMLSRIFSHCVEIEEFQMIAMFFPYYLQYQMNAILKSRIKMLGKITIFT